MSDSIVLFGAGTIGRLMARDLGPRVKAIADNDETKWGSVIEGIPVFSPAACTFYAPDALWMASVLRAPFRTQILAQLELMNVKTLPLSAFMNRQFDALPDVIVDHVLDVCADDASKDEIWNQRELRIHGERHHQRPFDDIKDVYFPPFIKWNSTEVFIDCGAADGDTVAEIHTRFGPQRVISFEPDRANYDAFQSRHFSSNVSIRYAAVSDFDGTASFTATGDQTAHFGNGPKVPVIRIDSLSLTPTFIKMDIEGAELNALWGARETIRKHSPILAICAYHTADHIWQIPLLIRAINPRYRLYLRRYLEDSWETIWYAVTPERVK